MDPNLILIKCITLLYRESLLENNTDYSNELVKTVVSRLQIVDMDIGISTRRSVAVGLKDLVLEMCRNPESKSYDLSDFLQQIRLLTNGDQNIYTAISQGLEAELTPAALKRTITNLRKAIGDHFREQKIGDIFKRASRDFNFARQNIEDIHLYVQNVINELTVASTKTSAKDPGIIKTMDFTDEASMLQVFSDVAASNTGDLPFMTGWRELNMALQGGPRPGDALVIGALQHNYKTGMSLSLFAHMACYNTPKCKDPTKKPLIYRVSLEDPLRNNAQFLYQLLKYEESGVACDIKGIAVEDMITYVKHRLSANGFHVIIDEVNPSNWTYQSLFNRIIELESQGYAVEVLSIDYLSKLPTTGCVQGSMGDDMLDLLVKTRSFCSAQGILLMTPHQLSTEAKRLLQTVPADQFLHHIKGGGFFEKTKGLDRIYDIGILVHKIETGGGDWLHVVVDKHRFPSVVDSSLKSFYLKFPSSMMPIPSNIHNEDTKIYRKLPKVSVSADDSFFS